jgi:hypothetical protein
VKKKLPERLRLNSERAKLLVSIGAVALVVLAAMLLPLAFRAAPGGEAPAAPLTLAERTGMFADYWTEGAEAAGFTVTKPDPVPRQMKERCETVMATLVARSIDDKALDDLSPTGSEYTAVTDAAGREIHVCRMWLERRGDWQNWMDVCMDADTGELYYYYLSRECLTNRKLYETPDTDAGRIAASLAEEYGWTLRYLAEEHDSGGAAAVYSSDGGTLCYQISCRVYDALTDIKVSCR